MHFICRSFIGSHDNYGWSQYWENEPDDPLIISRKGHLFGLISLISKENSNLNSIGHEIISTIDEHYFFDNEVNLKISLENAFSLISQNPLYSDIEISLIVAVVIKNRVYFGIYGSGEIILNRQDRISRVLSGKSNNFITLSGPALLGDKILLATSLFYEKFSWEKIKTILADENIQNIEENFLSSLYSFEDQTSLSAALVKIEADEIEQNENNNLKEKPIIVPPANKKKINFPKINFSFIKKIFAKKPVYVSHIETTQVSKRKKINLIVAVLLLFGLGTSSFLGYQKSQASKKETQYEQFKADLEKKLSDGFAVKNLNFDSALELAKQSQEIYSKMDNLKIHSDELAGYKDKIQSLLSQTGGSNSLLKNSFYDTSLIIDNPKFSKIFIKNNLLYLFDNSFGRIDTVDINQKNTKNIAINSNIKSASNITENNGNIYIFDGKTVSLLSKENTETKINFAEMNKNITPLDVKSWNGAFYLLDSSNSTIWKFNSNSSGFGAGEIWLKENEKLSNPSSLAINGNIWVLSKDGQISSYVRGVKDNFKQTNSTKFTDAKNLVVGVDSDILAFTDADNLIYVYKKIGDLISKYNLDNKKILSIAMDEKSNSLFVLCDDQKIYKINL